MTSHLFKTTLLLTTALTAATSFAQGSNYQLTLLKAPGQFSSPYITGINNSGQVTGSSVGSGPGFPNFRGDLWADGRVTALQSPGVTVVHAGDINDGGQIATTVTTANYRHAGILQGTSLIDIGTLNRGTASEAIAINNLGQVTGFSNIGGPLEAFASHALLWSNNHLTDLGVLGTGNSSGGYAINNAGHVVGESNLIAGSYDNHAVLWKNGSMIDLGAFNGGTSSARGINDADQIVGYATAGNGATIQNATLWQNGTATNLGGSFAAGSQAFAINNRGQIVGFAGEPYNPLSDIAVLWQNGNAINLNTYLDPAAVQAGWHLSVATAISDNGKIAGNSYNLNTGEHAGFMLSPVPEPETWASLLTGLAVMAWVGARRKRSA